MTHRHQPAAYLALVLVVALTLPLSAVSVGAAEAPVSVEKNPPGDIPDTQVFIAYEGPGFSMQVPEGWSRADEAAGARFFDKYDSVEATIADSAAAPTPSSVTAGEAATLTKTGRAVQIKDVKQVKLDGGRAVRIDYSSNSEPNAVTNKQIRLEAVRFFVFKNGKLVTLDMSAPFGADNVDQWNLMANSVRLK